MIKYKKTAQKLLYLRKIWFNIILHTKIIICSKLKKYEDIPKEVAVKNMMPGLKKSQETKQLPKSQKGQKPNSSLSLKRSKTKQPP